MRCVVTGASGFLGSYVARELVNRGVEVAIITRDGSVSGRLQDCADKLHLIQGDLQFPESYLQNFTAFKPEALLHLAWMGVAGSARNDISQAANITASLALAELAAKSGVKHFINAGSQAEYGQFDKCISESDPTHPTTLYGHCKLATGAMLQQICTEHEMRFAHLRVFSTYGPGNQNYWLIPYLITELLKGRSPKLTACEQKWDFLYATDAANAFADVLLNENALGIFNLGSGKAPLLRDTVEMIHSMVNPAIPLAYGEVAYRPDQIMHLEADIVRLKNTTRWQPLITLKEGLEMTIEWYEAQD